MSDRTRKKLEKALLFIEKNIEEKISAEQIAEHAMLSPFHFQRLFSAHLGESVGQYVLHRRLELAANSLSTQPTLGVLDIALKSGFETHSAFSRAFRQHFQVSPSEFRSHPEHIRIGLDESRPFLNTIAAKNLSPKVELKTLPTLFYQYSATSGTINGTFLTQALRDVSTEFQRLSQEPQLYGLVSAFPSSPQSLNDEHAQVLYGALFYEPKDHLHTPYSSRIEQGLWAVFEHIGHYDYLYQTWNHAFRSWLPSSGYELRDALPFELYLTSPENTHPQNWVTHIYVPLKASRD
ncbi:helix-turn-helix domain-containing protein [Vibrio kagoshimensis]|uniref:AraC family transcriptional regulator n=1 Tax=Vibrio kagoshimensis TaxID=2910244 RepID=UPI003D1A8D0B